MPAVKSLKDHCQITQCFWPQFGENSDGSGWSAGSTLGNQQVGAAELPGHFLTDIATPKFPSCTSLSPFLGTEGKNVGPEGPAASCIHSLAAPGHIWINSCTSALWQRTQLSACTAGLTSERLQAHEVVSDKLLRCCRSR